MEKNEETVTRGRMKVAKGKTGRQIWRDGDDVETLASDSIGKQEICDSSTHKTTQLHTRIRQINFIE